MRNDGEASKPVWNDPCWREKSDNRWRAGLRLQQAWWRQKQLELPPGPRSRGDDRLVVSMLPADVGFDPNLMTAAAVASAESAIDELRSRRAPGIISEDRLKRNLLSSQPLCFNVFGHLSATPDALTAWARTLTPQVERVTDVRLEWAPASGALGGSAFDAFVELELKGGDRGFLGVECKYAENLAEAQREPAREIYVERTRQSGWKDGAAEVLNRNGLRQLWYNQLLTQTVAANDGYSLGMGIVMACSADTKAREATDLVKAQLSDDDALVFSPFEDLVRSVKGHDAWRARVWQRYFDFSPIREHLPTADPRRTPQQLEG